MRAILINPEDKTVTEVDHNGDFHQIYELIGSDCFDIVRMTRQDCLYVDDMGLLRHPTKPFFRLTTYNQPLAGRGLILGENHAGNSTACNLTVDQVRAMVQFPEKLRLKGFEDKSYNADGVLVLERKAIFEEGE
jgi:hypothetical protein